MSAANLDARSYLKYSYLISILKISLEKNIRDVSKQNRLNHLIYKIF